MRLEYDIAALITLADPGFPRGGSQTSGRGAPTYYLAKCMPKNMIGEHAVLVFKIILKCSASIRNHFKKLCDYFFLRKIAAEQNLTSHFQTYGDSVNDDLLDGMLEIAIRFSSWFQYFEHY